MIVRRVVYLVANSDAEGIAYCNAQKWTRIAFTRYASDDDLDIRIATRAMDLVGTGDIPLMRTPTWDPDTPDAAAIHRSVEQGWAYWLPET